MRGGADRGERPDEFRRCRSEHPCPLYTSDAADDPFRVDLGGRRIIKKKNATQYLTSSNIYTHSDNHHQF